MQAYPTIHSAQTQQKFSLARYPTNIHDPSVDHNNNAKADGTHSVAGNSAHTPRSKTPRNNEKCSSPGTTLRLHTNHLSLMEQKEIFQYPQVYFIGPSSDKRHHPNLNQIPSLRHSRSGPSGELALVPAAGSGMIQANLFYEQLDPAASAAVTAAFDDRNCDYIVRAGDHVAYRYELQKLLGKGSFGQVVKSFDHKEGRLVALKIIRNDPRFARQAREEIRILQHLSQNDQHDRHFVVRILDSFIFRNHVCIVFELLSMNLYELIKKNKFRGFPLLLVRKFAISLLHCLDLLHKCKIIHWYVSIVNDNLLLFYEYNRGCFEILILQCKY